MSLSESFSELLKTYRKTMGWTQEELAKKWGYATDSISAWERGIRTPGGQQVPLIADWLKITPEELIKSINMVHNKPNLRRGHLTIVDEVEHELRNGSEFWGELQHIYPNRTAFNSEISYSRQFEQAHTILAIGISLNPITMSYSTDNIVKSVGEGRTGITLCFLDPGCPNCTEREREEGLSAGQLASLINFNIKNMVSIKKHISRMYPDSTEQLRILLYDFLPRYNIYVVDDSFMTVQPYAYGRGEDTPTLVLRRHQSNGLFEYYATIAKHILEQAKPLDS
jgi:transcriptional regulator with XRE-family HTH domain